MKPPSTLARRSRSSPTTSRSAWTWPALIGQTETTVLPWQIIKRRCVGSQAIPWPPTTWRGSWPPIPIRAFETGGKPCKLASQLAQGAGSKSPNAWGTLSAAFAETGQFEKAVTAVEEAIRLAKDQGEEALLKKLNDQLQTYRSKRPLREGETDQ